jgi:voltage-gated potassium channel
MSVPAAHEPTVRHHGNAYYIFILIATLLALFIMVLALLPVDEATRTTLITWDTVLCVIFLADFVYNISGSHPWSEYLIRRRGWLDLIGSIPTFGIYRFTILLRLFRVSRLIWISRRLGQQRRRELVADVLRNRGQYAFSFTALMALIVVSVASILVLQFESSAPDGNIKTGGDALWWAVVTLCTVGYGDYTPVTTLGRITGTFVMFAGIGIIGALASILASVLVSPVPEAMQPADEVSQLRLELERTQAELAALRQSVAGNGKGS